MAANDTNTELNPGTGGSKMDEALVVQSDGTTAVHRTRTETAYAADDAQGRVVSRTSPLPASDEETRAVLRQIADDLREIKIALFAFISG